MVKIDNKNFGDNCIVLNGVEPCGFDHDNCNLTKTFLSLLE